MVLLYILLCAQLFSLNMSWTCFCISTCKANPPLPPLPTEQLFLIVMYHLIYPFPLLVSNCVFSITIINILIVAYFIFVGQFPCREHKGLCFGECCQIVLGKGYTSLLPVVYENARCPALLAVLSVVRLLIFTNMIDEKWYPTLF